MYPLLEIKDLFISFQSENERTDAVKNIGFHLKRGETLAIVGESGSGKSVTALSVLQLISSAGQCSGKVLFSENGIEQTDLLKLDKKQVTGIRGKKIAMIFQEPMTSLNPVFSCGHQVAEAVRQNKKITASDAKQETINWFAKVRLPDPESIYHRYPHQLSGGQKQRVMIAMAMISRPSLLICDEPTTALDVTVQKSILQLLKELQQDIGIIFITHDLGIVAEIADRAIVMYKGEIAETNTVEELFASPKHPYTKGLLACRPVMCKKGERLPVVSDFMNNGKHHVDGKPPASTATKEPEPSVLLSAENLCVHYPAKKNFFGTPLSFVKAVDDVSFKVKKGETLGLVGESGCGKTTLGRALLRLIEPTHGKIIYNGIDLTAKKRDELNELRKNIQIVFQDPYSSLNPSLSIGSAIGEPLRVHGFALNDKTRKDKVVQLLEKVNLEPKHFSRYPHEFSGGQRQRIVIARALAMNPSFIVCDESVSALDVRVQAQVINLLNDLKKEFDLTIIFISHDLSVVRYISDRILVMHMGKIVEEGLADDIYYHPKQEYTKNLIASIPGKRL